jgi:hypothetical protein
VFFLFLSISFVFMLAMAVLKTNIIISLFSCVQSQLQITGRTCAVYIVISGHFNRQITVIHDVGKVFRGFCRNLLKYYIRIKVYFFAIFM